MSRYFSLHTHSRRSKDDALSGVTELVERAVELGYPALALTDHGTMGGAVELYGACKKAGIAALPGIELYLTPDSSAGDRSSMHLTLAAYTEQGYRNLVGLNNLAQSHFYRRPRVDFPQLAELAEGGLLAGIACATGCRSGPVVRALVERGPEAAEQVAVALAGWFDKLYVELMDHGFKADGQWDYAITSELFMMAERQGLPFVITSDTHYTLEQDKASHDALKTLVTWAEDPEDGKFSGAGYWLVDEAYLAGVYDPEVLGGALDHLAELAASARVKIPDLDVFSLKVPDVTFNGTQQQALQTRAWEAFDVWASGDMLLQKAKPSKAVCTVAHARLTAELKTVESSGFAGYLLFVIAITDYCWDSEIWYYTRGSATGSFLLWLAGVTQECPLPSEHDIRFDRFLSPDRTSPPDVDLDLEHTRRDEVVEHFGARYPVAQVGTTMTYGITTESEDEDAESGGSLAVKYYGVQRKLKTDVTDWASIPKEDKATLKELAERNLVSGRGAHSGGYVFADTPAVLAYLPMEFINSSKTMVTAFDKGEVEKMGLPKIDLLGSRVLTALRICCELITSSPAPAKAGVDPWASAREYYLGIPMEDKDTLQRCAAGRTVGTFQMGGYTNRKMLQEVKPKRVKDLIAVQALARPAPMKSGFSKSYLRRRDKAEAVPVMHNDIAAETKETYGLAIYQEQLVGVLRRLGLDALRLTRLLKAVKSSGKAHALEAAAIMDSEIGPLVEIAKSRDWSEADIRWLTDCLRDYGAGYSFGKAHSVQYGVTGYRTAYLAQHESLAYWTGMLIAYTGAKDPKTKEPLELRYKSQARKDGVKVLGPHVLHSGAEYTPDPEAFVIREGLLSVPQVGQDCAAELIAKRPYASLVDLAQRVTSKVTCTKGLLYGTAAEECGGHIAALHKAGALNGIPVGEPIRRAKGRIRRCQACKTTFATPLEYEDHVENDHPDEGEA